MKYIVAVFSLIGTTAVIAQGSWAVQLSSGPVEASFADEEPVESTGWGGGFVWTYGWAGENYGMAFNSGFVYAENEGPVSTEFGESTFKEMQVPVGFGFRLRSLAFGLAADYRYITSDLSGTEKQEGGSHNANGVLYGPYAHLALGRQGSWLGKFALSAKFMEGSANFNDPSDANGPQISTDAKDERYGFSFSPTGHWVMRLEHREVSYREETFTRNLFNKEYSSTQFTVGYIF